MKFIKFAVFGFSLVISHVASAETIKCTISGSVDGVGIQTQAITFVLDNNPEACVKTENYNVPNSSLEVRMKGHGACNPAPEFGCDSRPTIGATEIFDHESGIYAKANWTCFTPFETNHIQLQSDGNSKFGLIVWCDLIK